MPCIGSRNCRLSISNWRLAGLFCELIFAVDKLVAIKMSDMSFRNRGLSNRQLAIGNLQ